MKPNHIKAALVIALMMSCSNVFAQLYKTDFTTKIVLTNSGFPILPLNVYTLTAPASMTGPLTLTLPNTQGNLGDVLTNTGGGVLAWQNPLTSITLGGDVTGPAGTNTVTKINGQPLGSTAVTSGNLLLADGASWVSTPMSGDVTINGTGVTAIGANKVLNTMFRQSGAFSLVGNPTAGAANVTDITLDPTLTFSSGKLAFDLTHDNLWASTQTFGGVGKGLIVGNNGTTLDATLTVNGAKAFRYVDGNQTAGFVLTEDATGKATWTDPASSVILAGDVTGNAGTNAIAATLQSGNDIVAAINFPATAKSLKADVINYDNTLHVTSNQLGFDLGHDNLWASTQTFGGVGKGVVIGNNGTTLDATLTVNGATGFRYVDGNQVAGYILTEDATGKATWTNPATGLVVTMGGDVSGLSSAASVDKLKGNPLGSTAVTSGNLLLADGASWVSTPMSGDVTINGTGVTAIGANKVLNTMFRQSGAFSLVGNPTAGAANVTDITLDPTLTFSSGKLAFDLTHDNLWASTQTFGGVGKGLIVGNNGTTLDATLTVNGAKAFRYVDGNQTAGFVLTEDATGKATWTDPASSVILAGDVTGNAGTNAIAATLQSGNDIVAAINFPATAKSLKADVINYDNTLHVTSNQLGIDLNNTNTWNSTGGSQTFGNTAQTPGAVAFAAILPIGTTNTLYRITGSGTSTGMANFVDGRSITLTKTDAGFITLTSNAGPASQFLIPGGDPVIMGQGATVMLQYDAAASGWRVIGGF